MNDVNISCNSKPPTLVADDGDTIFVILIHQRMVEKIDKPKKINNLTKLPLHKISIL